MTTSGSYGAESTKAALQKVQVDFVLLTAASSSGQQCGQCVLDRTVCVACRLHTHYIMCGGLDRKSRKYFNEIFKSYHLQTFRPSKV